mmetsp:Transcript_8640/g.16319  ORF Transcript_8640/g.16319 Transcript_8640/m.16319 type:complete len:200 (-) Transcript_8640:1362-1961(-)
MQHFLGHAFLLIIITRMPWFIIILNQICQTPCQIVHILQTRIHTKTSRWWKRMSCITCKYDSSISFVFPKYIFLGDGSTHGPWFDGKYIHIVLVNSTHSRTNIHIHIHIHIHTQSSQYHFLYSRLCKIRHGLTRYKIRYLQYPFPLLQIMTYKCTHHLLMKYKMQHPHTIFFFHESLGQSLRCLKVYIDQMLHGWISHP